MCPAKSASFLPPPARRCVSRAAATAWLCGWPEASISAMLRPTASLDALFSSGMASPRMLAEVVGDVRVVAVDLLVLLANHPQSGFNAMDTNHDKHVDDAIA